MEIGAFVGGLTGWLHRLMPAGPRLDRLAADLEREFGGRAGPVTAGACREIEVCAQRHSRHLELSFDPDGRAEPDTESRGWPPPSPEHIRRTAGGIPEVRRVDGAAIVRVDALEAVAFARPYLDAAVALCRGADRIVLDLRGNGGGDPGMVAAIAEAFLGDEARQLSEVVYRDRRRQWWTRDRAPGSALRQPLAVLTGPGTYSSGEALAYHLQAHRRAVIVGEVTPGAADHVTPIRLSAQVTGLLPEGAVVDAVTGGNWEGTGVRPDVPCPAAKALDLALTDR